MGRLHIIHLKIYEKDIYCSTDGDRRDKSAADARHVSAEHRQRIHRNRNGAGSRDRPRRVFQQRHRPRQVLRVREKDRPVGCEVRRQRLLVLLKKERLASVDCGPFFFAAYACGGADWRISTTPRLGKEGRFIELSVIFMAKKFGVNAK